MATTELTQAQKAYKTWKELHKVNLQVYTDEQMFCLGFECRDPLVKDMMDLIDDLMARFEEEKKNESKDKSVRPPAKQASTTRSKRAPKQS